MATILMNAWRVSQVNQNRCVGLLADEFFLLTKETVFTEELLNYFWCQIVFSLRPTFQTVAKMYNDMFGQDAVERSVVDAIHVGRINCND